jgi:hypothetical protein
VPFSAISNIKEKKKQIFLVNSMIFRTFAARNVELQQVTINNKQVK